MTARTYIAGDPEAMNAVYEKQKRTGLNLSEILASMKEVIVLPKPIIDDYDLDWDGNLRGPVLGCLACRSTSLTRFSGRATNGRRFHVLDCDECLEEILIVEEV